MTMKEIIKNRKVRDAIRYGLSFLPDAAYIKLYYYATTGRWANLKCPQGYNEKLQWLKLHDRHWEYRDLADKYAVREYIKEIIGDQYLIPLLDKWERFDDIDFATLPNQFVLKCNHDSGSIKVIRDKSALSMDDIANLKLHFNQRMKHDFYFAGREYPYKGIKRYIIAERYMLSSNSNSSLNDYKFFCFGGKPKLLLVVSNRFGDKREDYFDMEGNWLHIRNGHHESDVCPALPRCFEKGKELAEKLAQNMRQVRMDFYESDGQIYFGEYTFFSGGGFELFEPEEWERKLGDWIDLSDLQ